MKTYMIVSDDELEIPVALGTAAELSRYLGLKSPQAVYKAERLNSRCKRKCRIVRVEQEGDVQRV